MARFRARLAFFVLKRDGKGWGIAKSAPSGARAALEAEAPVLAGLGAPGLALGNRRFMLEGRFPPWAFGFASPALRAAPGRISAARRAAHSIGLSMRNPSIRGRLATASLLALALGAAGCSNQAHIPQSARPAPQAAQSADAGPGAEQIAQAQSILSAQTPLFSILPPNAGSQTAPSYIFGGPSFGTNGAKLNAAAAAAIDSAQAVVTDIPAQTLNDPQAAQNLERLNRRLYDFRDKETLSKDLGDETGKFAQAVKDAMAKTPAAAQSAQSGAADHMRAFAALNLLAVAAPKQTTPDSGAAMLVLSQAAHAGKKWESLDTVAELIDRQSAISPEAAAKALKALIDGYDGLLERQKQMVDAYEKGDYAQSRQIQDEVNARLAAAASEAAPYFDRQNGAALHRAWADKIEGKARAGSIFAVVNQSHLTGPGGLIAMLLAHGWTVRPVDAETPAGQTAGAPERPATAEANEAAEANKAANESALGNPETPESSAGASEPQGSGGAAP